MSVRQHHERQSRTRKIAASLGVPGWKTRDPRDLVRAINSTLKEIRR